ncbi:hypothetical protein CAOG_02344 [Capsaspora owczarzaki ATCC 30864]|uniref:Carrier domain-containing protein n=1 Tax=Capsaspora owczarzaki (strain ATCC 30864) TaxID=595528 RepID=A0A0D2VM30_CAPO3|nr:hypothetical protein CAOG_02344 [Capsaspora owczarzaki ATCC 30864]KJE91167.1 hypothetical protein CAOG_002344 [Capsaspora owczarzaki ATCC 30864]|eukprot:XP_004349094.2 hypothetical protein CAOG_02344 [Capsaspora owczarzaki ATCC 30864]
MVLDQQRTNLRMHVVQRFQSLTAQLNDANSRIEQLTSSLQETHDSEARELIETKLKEQTRRRATLEAKIENDLVPNDPTNERLKPARPIFICDACRVELPSPLRFHCAECNYDLCLACAGVQAKPDQRPDDTDGQNKRNDDQPIESKNVSAHHKESATTEQTQPAKTNNVVENRGENLDQRQRPATSSSDSATMKTAPHSDNHFMYFDPETVTETVERINKCKSIAETWTTALDLHSWRPSFGFRRPLPASPTSSSSSSSSSANNELEFEPEFRWITMRTLHTLVRQFAAGLVHLLHPKQPPSTMKTDDDEILQHQTFVAICGFNRLEWFIADFACAILGIVAVPIHTAISSLADLAHILNTSNVEAAVCSDRVLPAFLRVQQQCPQLKFVIRMVGIYPRSAFLLSQPNRDENHPHSFHKQFTAPAQLTAAEISQVVDVDILPVETSALEPFIQTLQDELVAMQAAGAAVQTATLIPFTDVLECGRLHPSPIYAEPSAALTALIHTSGSTGRPKGAMMTSRIWRGFIVHSSIHGNDPAVSITKDPLSHISDRQDVHGDLSHGYRIGILSSLANVFDDIRLLSPNYIASTPRMWNVLYSQFQHALAIDTAIEQTKLQAGASGTAAGTALPSSLPTSDIAVEVRKRTLARFKQSLGHRLNYAAIGGALPSERVLAWMRECWGPTVVRTGYGITEAGSVADNDGKLYPHVQWKLVDVPELGYFKTDLPFGRGELLVQSTALIPGYFRNEEATTASFDPEGWFRTGDIVELLEEYPAKVRIIDRRKNFFKLSQGEFVSPPNLENTFLESRFVNQIFVTRGSYSDFDDQVAVVAIVVPHVANCIAWLHQHPTSAAGQDQTFLLKLPPSEMVAALCQNTEFADAVMADIRAVGTASNLQAFALPSAIHLESTEFSVDNGLLTPSGKTARPALERHYKPVVAEMLRAHAHVRAADESRVIEQQLLDLFRAALPQQSEQSAATTASLPPSATSFTRSGGDSMSAVRLVQSVKDKLSIDLPLELVLRNDLTIPQLIGIAKSTLQQQHQQPPNPVQSHRAPMSDGASSSVNALREASIGQMLSDSWLPFNTAPSDLICALTRSFEASDSNVVMKLEQHVAQAGPDPYKDVPLPLTKTGKDDSEQYLIGPRVAVLTGATGFLGAHLLHSLLEQREPLTNAFSYRQVVCIVRAESDAVAAERVEQALKSFSLVIPGNSADTPLASRRWRAVAGDLEKQDLGFATPNVISTILAEIHSAEHPDDPLTGSEFAELDARELCDKPRVSDVFHCAAQVNHAKPYTELRQANVLGTWHLLQFALEQSKPQMNAAQSAAVDQQREEHAGQDPAALASVPLHVFLEQQPCWWRRPVRFHMVSTESVGVSSATMADQPVTKAYSTCRDLLPKRRRLITNKMMNRGGYSQSKFVAECLCAAVRHLLRVFIYRPGMISFSTATGQPNRSDWFTSLFYACAVVDCVPRTLVQMSVIPVDRVSQALAALARHPDGDFLQLNFGSSAASVSAASSSKEATLSDAAATSSPSAAMVFDVAVAGTSCHLKLPLFTLVSGVTTPMATMLSAIWPSESGTGTSCRRPDLPLSEWRDLVLGRYSELCLAKDAVSAVTVKRMAGALLLLGSDGLPDDTDEMEEAAQAGQHLALQLREVGASDTAGLVTTAIPAAAWQKFAQVL